MSNEIDDVSWPEFAPTLVLDGAEFYGQLDAIRGFLSSQQQAHQVLSQKLRDCEQRISKATGDERQSLIEGEYLELYDRYVYEGSARSMASVGMLAPLVETLFKRLARLLKTEWPKSGQSPSEVIIKLIDDHQIDQMPTELGPVFTALFGYRNQMFHHGFEWPLHERHKFKDRILKSGWSTTWFDHVILDGRPWITYMSDEFVTLCLYVVEEVLNAVATFLKSLGINIWWREYA